MKEGQDPEAPPEEDQGNEFATNVIENLWNVFWGPEVERRGGVDVTGPIHEALAVLHPGQPVQLLLNEEAELSVKVRMDRAIDAGDPVYATDFHEVEDLRPLRIDGDAAWAALVVLPDGRALAAFDFRRNRDRARRLLDLADEYLATARDAARATHQGPTLENAHAAAELAVTAMMYLSDDEPIRNKRGRHNARLAWMNSFTRLGNAPRELHRALDRIGQLRPLSRYGEGIIELPDDELTLLIDAVNQLIGHARNRVGEPLDPLPDISAKKD